MSDLEYLLESALKANIENSKSIHQLTELISILSSENKRLDERIKKIEMWIDKNL